MLFIYVKICSTYRKPGECSLPKTHTIETIIPTVMVKVSMHNPNFDFVSIYFLLFNILKLIVVSGN